MAVNTSRDWVGGRNSWSPKQFPLKNPHTDLDSLPLSSSTMVAAWKAPVAYREELKWLASRPELEESLLPNRKGGRGHCSFSEQSSHRAPALAGGCLILDSIKLATTVCPTRPGDPLRLSPIQLTPVNSGFSMWMAGLGSCFTTS